MDGKDAPVKPARGRPRDLAAKEAILRAARALLDEGGPGNVTMEGVSSRAGVGKPTVYRWWPDRHAVLMAALMATDALPSSPARPHATALESLRGQLRKMVTRFASPTGRHITSMLAAADPESELAKAFRGHFVLARRAEGREILERGIANGELRGGLDVEVALDALYGAVFFRLLLGHAPLDAAFVDSLLEQAMDGMRVGTRRSKGRQRG
jgi:AcrR family transcriptional regulator